MAAHVVDGWMSKVQGRGRGSGAAERVATSAEQTFRGGILLFKIRPNYRVVFVTFYFFSLLIMRLSHLTSWASLVWNPIPSPALLPRRVIRHPHAVSLDRSASSSSFDDHDFFRDYPTRREDAP